METYYIIYRITNEINGKIYIGSHKTKNLEDGYMGSGKYLKYSQEKHGIENFRKEILFVFGNPEAMYAKEAELVNADFLAEENTYNLKLGGHGGWDYVNSNLTTEFVTKRAKSGRKAANVRLAAKYGANWKKVVSDLGHKKIREIKAEDPEYHKRTSRSMQGRNNPMFGKKHSADTRKKLSATSSGENNSQFGKKWIYSVTEKRSIKIGKYDPIPDGWEEGRKLKS